MKKILSLSLLLLCSQNYTSFFKEIILPGIGAVCLSGAQVVASEKIDPYGMPILPLHRNFYTYMSVNVGSLLCMYPFIFPEMSEKQKTGCALVGSGIIAGHLLYRYAHRIPPFDYRARS